MQKRLWLQHYPAAVPADIPVDGYESVPDLLDRSISNFSALPAFNSFGQTLSYQHTGRLAKSLAAYFLIDLQLKKGDRVALMLPNCLQYPVALWGTLRAGLVVVNINPRFTQAEVHDQLVETGARVLIVIDSAALTVAQVKEKTCVEHIISTSLFDLVRPPRRQILQLRIRLHQQSKAVPIAEAIAFKTALARGKRAILTPVVIKGTDLALLQFTGGTTGVSKAAMLTHRNLIANAQQCLHWLTPTGLLKEGQERILTVLPLYHIFAMTVNCLVFMLMGACNYLISNPSNLTAIAHLIQKKRLSVVIGVNTLFSSLLNTPTFQRTDFQSLKLTIGGGMAVQRSIADRWQTITGQPIIEAYGLTESSPAACANPLCSQRHTGSIGLPLPSTWASIQDDACQHLGINTLGELCLRGPQIMQGYWQRPEETAKVIDANRWLHTGDIAYMDQDGYFYVVDRKKDLILVAGYNVYPKEIEEAIAELAGVAEVAAIGVPHRRLGEVVKAMIVRHDTSLTAEKVRAHARQCLAHYKQPRRIEFVDQLPKSAVGKVLRRALRPIAAHQADQPDRSAQRRQVAPVVIG